MDMSLKEGCRSFILVRIDVVRERVSVTVLLLVVAFISLCLEIAFKGNFNKISPIILTKGGSQRK